MKYTFSNFTGRLSAPSALDTPTKFGHHAEGPTIQYQLGTTFPKELPPHRGGGKFGAVPDALQKKMRLFQFPNNMPVHIKGGPFDKMLFGLTGAVCLLGLFECFRTYWVLSWPQKPE